ncbi:hemolysin-type calcium-binding region [Tolypothrix tenuis PCC 7101]|uniref:Hemolysin-type calcium-binding region n=1 Tax=Tolypothrix tenuis PCC 7101 TaxID=231146 RepID=A0A1Z4MV49_9CYAN|nr:hypothetical protein [Aulosira sp. FACHB-113]BAY97359.1 hemolysin-type calcium-binding region [Tolypothrix tenuis PCC 7101]BAZ72132.1 hemolysin-type calcium-binding region [Aulosira laxa NIES-50]
MAYTTQEQNNINVVKGFFASFRQKNATALNQYIDSNVTSDGRFIIVRGGKELYDGLDANNQVVFQLAIPGGETPQKNLNDTNAYADDRFSHERNALVPETTEYIGPAGVKNFIAALEADFDFNSKFFQFNDLKYIADGNKVAVYGYLRYVHSRTGNFVSTPFAINITMSNDGKIQLYHYYDNSFAYAAGSREGGTWQGQYGVNLWEQNASSPLGAIHPVNIRWGTRASEALNGDSNPSQLRDVIYGYQGNDTITGGIGDDYLNGGSGNDILNGGDGNDILWGGIGFDTATGGAGNDFFVLYSDAKVAKPGDEGFLTVTDFADGADKLVGAPALLDSTDGINVTELAPKITFSMLKIEQQGADTAISLNSTGEKLALLKNINASQITTDDFIEAGPQTKSTVLQEFPAFRGYPTDNADPANFTTQAEAGYRQTVLGFFNAFGNGTIIDYIANNFASDVKYIIIESQNSYFEEYNSDINGYSVSFSHERFGITPPTQEWQGIAGAQAFINSLGEANDLTDSVTKFLIDDVFQNGPDLALFGRFEYRDKNTKNVHDVPFAYDFHVNPTSGKVDFIHFYEDAYSYSIAARKSGTWTANLSADQTVDFTFGTTGEDEITGGDRKDQIYGYQGDDTINGGKGNDTLIGGGGQDTFLLAAGQGTDTINDFEKGADKIKLLKDLNFSQLTITPTSGNVEIKVTATNEVLAVVKGSVQLDASDFIASLKIGTPNADDLFAGLNNFDGNANVVFTGAGDDKVDLSTSKTGRNRLFGGSGGDEIYVGKNDRVFGGSGNDTFDATDGQGGNRISGGVGDDTFFLRAGDRALGGEGNDIFIQIGDKDKTLIYGNNILTGGAGADEFWLVNAEIPTAPNTITDFVLGTDIVKINGYQKTDLTFTQDAQSNAILAVSGTNVATFLGITQAQLQTESAKFVFA